VARAVDQLDEALTITTAEPDSQGRGLVYANRAFLRLTGYTAADLVGSPADVPPPGESTSRRKDGSTILLQSDVVALRDVLRDLAGG
jgi:PAS domain-containing protein